METRRILVRLLGRVALQVVVRTSSSFGAAEDTERMDSSTQKGGDGDWREGGRRDEEGHG